MALDRERGLMMALDKEKSPDDGLLTKLKLVT